MNFKTIASAAPFAHLLGRRPTAAAPGALLQEEDVPAEDDEEASAEEDGEDDDKEKGKKGKKAKKARSEDDDAEEDDGESAEDDEVEEDEDKKEAKAARKAERARCRAIFAHSAAHGRPDVAASLAFDTDLSAKQAIAVMKSVTGGGRASRLEDRMSHLQVAQPGPSGGETPDPKSPQSVAAAIIAAGKKARGEA